MSLQNQFLEEKINSLENLFRVSLDDLRTRILSEVDLRINSIEKQPSKANDQNIKNQISFLAIDQKKSLEEIKQRILNEVESKIKNKIDSKLEKFRSSMNNERINTEMETFDPPQLNYKILPPEETGDFQNNISAVFMEIPFKPEDLHVLGLKGGNLYWIKTEDCE